MNDAAIERIATHVIADLERGTGVPSAALVLLVRRYARSGSAAIGDVLASALAATLEDNDDDRGSMAARVLLLTEAAVIADDDRLAPAVKRLAGVLEAGCPDRGPFVRALAAVEALLRASPFLDGTACVTRAIDELERLIGSAYEPGEGLVRTPPAAAAGTVADHVAAARTLLTAFEVSGRIPYAMLAEELMRVVRPALLTPSREPRAPTRDFLAACEAARVFCRLASLHEDGEYRTAAVVAAGANYAEDARCVLQAIGPQASSQGAHAAAYAIALGEWLARTV